MKPTAPLSLSALLLAACATQPPDYPAANFPESLAVAPPEEALTFARTDAPDGPHLWAVAAFHGDTLTAFNLTRALGPQARDPITAFHLHGYDALSARIAAGLAQSPEAVAAQDLILPVDLTSSHIAAGTNFAAHAEESAVEDGPFLFAKQVAPTPFRAPVSVGEALLDYEVELAFVTLQDTPLPQVPQTMGLILANDFTDRAALMRHINTDDVTSGDGFTTGKSAPGYLPVGNLFVIPRDLHAFVAATDLSLAVNGRLRQRAPMTLAIWDIHELLRQTQARTGVRWDHHGEQVGLPIVDGAVPARTLILAGTPDGTIFQGVPRAAMARGLLRWLAFGWNRPLTDRVIESTIRGARKQGNYLQPGDRVLIRVDRLGTIETLIVE
jgi:2,4-didehydro-3-deoxy-L-rhamnonate hydrolase